MASSQAQPEQPTQPAQIKKERFKWRTPLYVLILLLITLAMVAALWGIYRSYQERSQLHFHQVESRLRLVSDVQTQNVVKWRKQHLAEAATLSNDPLYAQALQQWLASGKAPGQWQSMLTERLHNFVHYNEYTMVHLLDTQGRWLHGTTTPSWEGDLPQPELLALAQALETALPVMVEPRGGKDTVFAFPAIAVMAPIYDEDTPLGVVWMVLDMRTTLFPLLQSWQLGSENAESILTQRTATGIVNVNPMRSGGPDSFEANLPMSRTISPGVQAVQGVRGVVHSVNYRDEKVLAMLSQVEQSPWWLVLQVNEDEALSHPQRREGLMLGLQIGAVLLLAAWLVGLWQWFAWRKERQLKHKLEQHMRWLGTAQRAAGLGYFAYHLGPQKFYLSESAAEILGQPSGSLSLKEWAALIVPADKKRILRLHSESIGKGEAVRSEYRIRHPHHQQERWIQVWAEWDIQESDNSPIPVQRMLGIAQDITERKQIETDLANYRQLLENQVRQDPLTALANRLALDEAVTRQWQRAKRRGHYLAVLMMDIDHFKTYNDTYGHLQGDECLRQVAQALANSIQREGELVARYGGEEFAVLLPHADETQALECAQMLLNAVYHLGIAHSATSVPGGVVSISIGAASLLPALDQDLGAAALFARADQALYAAKEGGRNRCCGYSQTVKTADSE